MEALLLGGHIAASASLRNELIKQPIDTDKWPADIAAFADAHDSRDRPVFFRD